MIPNTRNGLNRSLVISAMQKHIRRGNERDAMLCAVEVGMTDKAGFTWVCNRLELISHEDIGLTTPDVIPLVHAAVDQAKRHYSKEKPGRWWLILGNAIRFMCRAEKTREGDHFAIALGWGAELKGLLPDIPDHAHDMHTRQGKKMNRGVEHFIEEGSKLENEVGADRYRDEAHDTLRLRFGEKSTATK